eukprot:jgi/Psemu1/52437/gm1.52437_g
MMIMMMMMMMTNMPTKCNKMQLLANGSSYIIQTLHNMELALLIDKKTSAQQDATTVTTEQQQNWIWLHREYAKKLLTISKNFNTFGDKGDDFVNAEANTHLLQTAEKYP